MESFQLYSFTADLFSGFKYMTPMQLWTYLSCNKLSGEGHNIVAP